MSYEAKQTKNYNQAADEITKSASTVLESLGGKASKKNKPEQGRLDVNFNKKLKGKFMNNRVQVQVQITAQSPEQCTIAAQAYPVDPVGMKLTFGVQGKPAHQVLEVFFSELESQIGS